MTRWLITGARGLLGRELLPALERAGQPYVALGHEELDVADPRAVRAAMTAHRPGVVVNAAAYTDVDGAESEPARALRVNGDGPRRLAGACGDFGSLLVQVSTDYVFPGEARTPYPEDARPEPLSTYGRTKLEGERAVLQLLPWTGYVVRTAWLYGSGGNGFVGTLIRLEREREYVDVADGQCGQPTWSADAAGQIVALGRAALHGTADPGIYHATSGGGCTRVELAREVFRLLGADPARIRPVPGAFFATPARRPPYSVLGHDRWNATGVGAIRDWREALREAFPAVRGVAGPLSVALPVPASVAASVPASVAASASHQ
ncbi:dTDP-4-dehydrorhamnose reductase (plasmid) [Streptomyces sp. NBC_00876]|uniref:dTDP-4-dehydrorhamnose reductase n=1 Tax=Streptomyces sp. NBC_00876 TaxID=2975853 RepID=UPI002F90FED5|nr:dTDP-4-dehydrorhamnose reductase [Streptomyces sp. NBC_00876]